jgi:hypothetical protein
MDEKRWSSDRIWLVAKAVWVIANLLILLWSLRLDSQRRFEEQIIVFFVYSVISFPCGLLLYFLIGTLDLLLGGRILDSLPDGWPAVVIQCAFFFLAGYVQWFKLLRYVLRKAQEYDNERRELEPDANNCDKGEIQQSN